MKKFSVDLSNKVLSFDKKVEELTEKATIGDKVGKKVRKKKEKK